MRTELNEYLEMALWSSADENGNSMDALYDIDDFAPEAIEHADEELADFESQAESLLTENDTAHVGHDFWLTRNGHGAGFWDGDYKNGYKLTELCRPYGSSYIYVGDDGKLYLW